MSVRYSIEARIARAEKELGKEKELSAHDLLMIDYYLTQCTYGFDDCADATEKLSEWRQKLGKKGWVSAMEQIEKKEVAAKLSQNSFKWKRLLKK